MRSHHSYETMKTTTVEHGERDRSTNTHTTVWRRLWMSQTHSAVFSWPEDKSQRTAASRPEFVLSSEHESGFTVFNIFVLCRFLRFNLKIWWCQFVLSRNILKFPKYYRHLRRQFLKRLHVNAEIWLVDADLHMLKFVEKAEARLTAGFKGWVTLKCVKMWDDWILLKTPAALA